MSYEQTPGTPGQQNTESTEAAASPSGGLTESDVERVVTEGLKFGENVVVVDIQKNEQGELQITQVHSHRPLPPEEEMYPPLRH